MRPLAKCADFATRSCEHIVLGDGDHVRGLRRVVNLNDPCGFSEARRRCSADAVADLSRDSNELAEARSTLSALGIEAVPLEVSGNPAQAICVEAERHAYDTIVVGRRNLRDAGLILLGSVAARVVAGASVSVLVVA
jgi:nucleotide-binding universal stress UspA family protein